MAEYIVVDAAERLYIMIFLSSLFPIYVRLSLSLCVCLCHCTTLSYFSTFRVIFAELHLLDEVFASI